MNNKFKCSALMVLLLGSGSISLGSDVSYLKVNDSIKNYKTANYTKTAVQKVSLNSLLTKNLNPAIAKTSNDSGIRLAKADVNSDIMMLNLDQNGKNTEETIIDNSETRDSVDNQSDLTVTERGSLEVTNDFTNETSGTLQNQGTVQTGGKLDNSGSIENSGFLQADGDLSNSGKFNNSKSVVVDGTFSNSGSEGDKGLTNSGTFTVNGSGSHTNSGKLSNSDEGSFTVQSGKFSNSGTITNGGSGSSSNMEFLGGLDNSSGSINNESGAEFTVTGDFTNGTSGSSVSNGSITNSGNFTFGDMTNNGTFNQKGGTVTASGTVNNNNGGNITVQGGSFGAKDLTNNGKFENQTGGTTTIQDAINNETGTLTNEGKLSANSLTNTGSITNSSTQTDGFSITGEIKNQTGGTFTNSSGANMKAGSITNESQGKGAQKGFSNSGNVNADSFTNKGGSAENIGSGQLTLSGEFKNGEENDNSTFDNSGTITVEGDITNNGTLKNNAGSLKANKDFTNKGTFNNSAETTVSGKLENTANGDKGITNSGKFTVTGEADNKGNITNNSNGSVTFNGTTSNSGNITNSANGTVNFKEGLTNNGSIINSASGSGAMNFEGTLSGLDSASIQNSGNMNLNGDASAFKGSYTQTGGSLTVNDGSSFFGGKSSVSSGDFNWKSKDGTKSVDDLNLSGDSKLNITDGGQLTLGGTSSIADAVTSNIEEGTNLKIQGSATVDFGTNDTLNGNVSLEGGTLTLHDDLFGAGKSNKGTLSATSGKLDLQSDFTFSGSSVAKEVELNIGSNTAHLKNGANFTIDEGDTWSDGNIQIDDADSTLNVEGKIAKENNGSILAEQGNVNFKKDSDFTLDEGTKIGKDAKVNIETDSNLTIDENGNLYLGDDDTWNGNVNLTEGTLQYGKKEAIDGTLNATGGTLSLVDEAVFTLQNSGGSKSTIEDAVNVEINDGTTLKVSEGAEFNMDSADKWAGLVDVEANGKLNAKGVDNTKDGGGIKQVTGGTSVFSEGSNVVVTDSSSSITGGTVELKDKSKLTYGGGQKFQSDDLIIEDGSTFGIMNGALDSATSDEVQAGGEANFTFDISQRQYKSDNFEIGEAGVKLAKGADSGNLNISDFNLLGDCPVDRRTRFQFFNIGEAEIPEGVEFTATKEIKRTPSGWFGLNPVDGMDGYYDLYMAAYVPEEFRGQAAILGMYTNQLQVNDIVTNHFILHDETLIDSAKNANKYSAASPLFAPYQKTYKDGGIWSKSYASFDKLDLTNGLGVGSNTYGTLLGADLPAVELNKDWTFIPTGYVGYNGAHQYFDGVSSYQNGGQLGVMGTFIKNEDFITSVTAYGGGYTNEMSYGGYNDNTGNWFAGSAVKTAYNLHALKDFIVQPNLLVAYNAFGRQSWHSDYGNIDMMTKMFNGINAAPGVNFILSKDTWSLYATFQYMFFMNDKVDGTIGNIELPGTKLEHGVFQYGIGGTKKFNDTLAAYGQINLRNAGITGIGFQLGLQWLFNLKLPWN